MTADDPADDRKGHDDDGQFTGDDEQFVDDDEQFVDDDPDRTRERLEERAERAVDEFDQGIVDLLAWLLDTETRARIYVHLRQHPDATSEEIADGTGLYPSTVREALSDLHAEDIVTRQKRESEGAGNNPYAYRAIPPSELVSSAVGDIQSELNAVFTLDDRLRGGSGTAPESETEPVTISVESASADDAEPDEDNADATEADAPDDTGSDAN